MLTHGRLKKGFEGPPQRALRVRFSAARLAAFTRLRTDSDGGFLGIFEASRSWIARLDRRADPPATC